MSRWINGVLVIAVVLALSFPAQAEKVTIQRPLSDFLNAQGFQPRLHHQPT